MKKTEWKERTRGLGAWFGRFKYPLLALGLGLLVLLLPTRSQTKEDAAEPVQAAKEREDAEEDEARMEEILSQIQGAGRVRVMLQYAAGEKSIYQTDSEQEVRSSGGEKETRTSIETVLSSRESSRDSPVVVQTVYPTYRGAVVVAEGADDGGVKLDLVQAVSSLTGLGADKITVMKMKSE